VCVFTSFPYRETLSAAKTAAVLARYFGRYEPVLLSLYPTTVQNRVFRISLKMARTCKKVGEWGFRVDFNPNPHKTKESG
jgi:hypothetical protein